MRGATMDRWRQVSTAKNFNPRSPCGERQRSGQYSADYFLISTHAPHAGSDLAVTTVSRAIRYFNPRSPCGVCFVKQIFRKSSSNSFGSQHERSSDFTKGCGTYPSFLFPSMSESVTRRLSPLNSTSLPWWTILSTSADASLSSANTVPHFPNSMLVVSTIDWRS